MINRLKGSPALNKSCPKERGGQSAPQLCRRKEKERFLQRKVLVFKKGEVPSPRPVTEALGRLVGKDIPPTRSEFISAEEGLENVKRNSEEPAKAVLVTKSRRRRKFSDCITSRGGKRCKPP